MCGRFSQIKAQKDLEYYYQRHFDGELKPNYNVAPTQNVPVVTKDAIVEMKWGLVPIWARDSKVAYTMINARSETIYEKTTYKKPFLEGQRVLVPSTGFYEWRKPERTPFFIHLLDRELFSMAGLYIKGKDDIYYFTIITTQPNHLMESIHDRMPVILTKEEEKDWLDDHDPTELIPMMNAYPDQNMEAYEISKDVGNVRNNFPELLTPIKNS
ncbi:MAG: SOS response-associated peptidase [Candidatus Saccharimonadia bacterium]